jgi:hypothetical protein
MPDSRALAPPTKQRHALPWEQLPDETPAAYSHFLRFLAMGHARTVHRLSETLRAEAKANKEETTDKDKPSPGEEASAEKRKCGVSANLRQCSTRFQWRERAAAYDHAEHVARERERLRLVAEDERHRFQTRRRTEQQTLDTAGALRVKALRMLQWPLEHVTEESRTVEDDGRTIIVRTTVTPVRWGMRDIAIFLRLAQELEDRILLPQGLAVQSQPASHNGITSDDADPAGEGGEGGLQPTESEPTDAELEAAARETLSAWWHRQNRRMLETPPAPVTPSLDSEADRASESHNGQEGPSDTPGSIAAGERGIYPPTSRGPHSGPPGASSIGPAAIRLGSGRNPAPGRGLIGS